MIIIKVKIVPSVPKSNTNIEMLLHRNEKKKDSAVIYLLRFILAYLLIPHLLCDP